ncbi:MAG TPA: hypothetical protein VKU01_35530 [Bryobacteraceae bacterium]|nr:hypothetical protein [Bryobacteraceae bacterium]
MSKALLLAAALSGLVLHADAPFYSAASTVNSADNQAWLAPNSIGTIYGAGLAYATRSLTWADISGGTLPTTLPGTGARILIGGIAATVYYISPTQINFLVPSMLLPGPTDVQVMLDGVYGPSITIILSDAAPALFQLDPLTPVATRLDGSVISAGSPARPGDFVTLYATGLGDTIPPAQYAHLAVGVAPLQRAGDFRVMLDGMPLDAGSIYYAGLAPGYAGLYQINIKLPDNTGANPELQIALGDAISVTGLILPVQPW